VELGLRFSRTSRCKLTDSDCRTKVEENETVDRLVESLGHRIAGVASFPGHHCKGEEVSEALRLI
jgi:hypothetical protein